MKFNFKRIASVLVSAVMLSSTVALAAAVANQYPEPFVKNGVADVAVVYGSAPAVASTDILKAQEISTKLGQAQIAAATTVVATSVTTPIVGENVNLASSSQKLFYGSGSNAAKTTVSGAKGELATLLKDGSLTDDAGTAYTYQQSMNIGNRTIAYSTSDSDLTDPELIVDLGTLTSAPVYTYKLTFNGKNPNITLSTVQGNDIEVFGKKFTIGANSDAATALATSKVLYLYGSGASVTLNEGDEKTVDIGGKSYTIKLTSATQTSSTNYASISVNGGAAIKIAENTASTSGGITIYAKSVTYSAKESTINSATLNLGGEVLKLQDGATVYKGTDETSIQGTKVTLTDSTGKLSAIQVAVAAQSTTADYLKSGQSFVDPIFGGLKLTFTGVSVPLNDSARGKVLVDTDNARNVRVTFTSALAGTEKQFTFVHDQDTSEDTTTPILADASNHTIHIVEGEAIALNDYAVINSGDYGRIVQLTGIPTGTLDSSSKIHLVDAVTNTAIWPSEAGGASSSGLTIGTTGYATTNIDGQPYYFTVTNTTASTLQIYWGAGANGTYAGSATTVAPRIKLASGGWMAIIKPTTLTNATTYSLPGTDTLATYESGNVLAIDPTAAVTTYNTASTASNIHYLVDNSSAKVWGAALRQTTGVSATSAGTAAYVNCSFNYTGSYLGAAILVFEPKKTTESGNSDNGDVICIAADANGASAPIEVSVNTPKASGTWSGLQTWTSDSYQQAGITRYGTFVKYNSQDNDRVEVLLPVDQMYGDEVLTSEATQIGTTTTTTAVGTALSLKDSEVTSFTNKNLIVVGGSCINTVAAKLLGSSTPLCTTAFTAATGIGAGQYLIKTFDSPYVNGTTKKVATLVAGYEAAETVNAADFLLAQNVSTAVGDAYATGVKKTVTGAAVKA